MVKKNRSVKSRELSDHIVAEGTLVEKNAVDNRVEEVQWEAKQGEVHADTQLSDDMGDGNAVIVRAFDFKANPQAFRERTPSKQELFNAHAKQIEVHLWTDGLKVMPEIEPRLIMEKKNRGYRIIVGAEAVKGQLFSYQNKPQTLTQITNASSRNNPT
jgi:phage terminase large subunit